MSGKMWTKWVLVIGAAGFVVLPALAQQQPAKPAQAKPAQTKPAAPAKQGFGAYLQTLWPLAQARGIPRGVFDAAISGLTPDTSIIALTKKQSEFVKPIWGYLSSAVTGGRIGRGQQAGQQHASALSAAESRYGVPKEIILGIWGMETNYGSYTGDKDVFRSLATLAWQKYRGEFFRDELINAMEILAKGKADRAEMKGSWAGAMGHTQFMPSSYLQYAVDMSGDGHADIWDSPTDAIGSTGNYLKGYGWQAGLPWGFEVELPTGLDLRTIKRGFSAWGQAGVKRMDGAAMPWNGEASLFLPGGITGPAFLVTANYDVIKKYNNSDAYALAVAHLGDRIMGRAGIQGDWPSDEPQLSKPQREEVQKRLKALGHYNDKIDGRLGSGTREAVRRFQLANGMVADGYANPALLAKLRSAAR
ncbi:MAG: lytic murein transglycosylase [Bosea sp. (in: a-proteobacteria)]